MTDFADIRPLVSNRTPQHAVHPALHDELALRTNGLRDALDPWFTPTEVGFTPSGLWAIDPAPLSIRQLGDLVVAGGRTELLDTVTGTTLPSTMGTITTVAARPPVTLRFPAFAQWDTLDDPAVEIVRSWLWWIDIAPDGVCTLDGTVNGLFTDFQFFFVTWGMVCYQTTGYV